MMLTEKEKELLELYRVLDEAGVEALTEEEAKIYKDLEDRYLTPEEQTNIQTIRESALKEQADYQNLSKAVDNDWYHLGSDALLGKVFTDDNQGVLGKVYDAGSYPLRLALGGYEGLAKSIYSGLESGAQGVQRVSEGKDLNYLEKEATNPINVAAAIGSPFASNLVRKAAIRFLPSIASLIDKGGKLGAALGAGQEGIAQGALVAPGQTFAENLKRSSKGEEEERLDYGPMIGYGALGGGLGELGARGLKGLGKKAFSSEVKVRPSLQQKAANPPNVDFLFDLPKEYTGATPRGKYNPRKWLNYGREPGYVKDGKFVETTSELIPLGGLEDLNENIKNLSKKWLEARNSFAEGTDVSTNLQKIFENAWEEIRADKSLGHSEKVTVLKNLQAEYEDALRTYHFAKDPVKDVMAVGAGAAGVEDVGKLAQNYPKDLSVPGDVMSLTDNIGKVPVIPFEDLLNLRSRYGLRADYDKYNDPIKETIDKQLYRSLYKNINNVITKPAQKFVSPSAKANEIMNKNFVVGHNLSGPDLEYFLKTQDVLKHTTPWETELPRSIARTTNKNLVGLPELIGTGAVGLVGGTGGNALIDEDDSEAQKLGKIFGGAVVGGLGGLGAVKATMRGLGPARVMYETGKSLSREAAPSITLQQFEKDKKNQKTEDKKAAKRAQILTNGGSTSIQVVPVDKQWSSVESMR